MERNPQHYALDESDNPIHISEVDKITRQTYRCPNCKQEMIAKQGSIREWHFAHKKTECEYDKYLHTLAEIRISEWYNKQVSIPLILRHPTVCAYSKTCKWLQKDKCRGNQDEEINLKKWLSPTCELEKEFIKDNKRFVADVFCPNIKNENNPVFIEIYVTHRCEEEKRKSGIKIIEVKIENETDIDTFINNPIKVSEKVRFYNFYHKVIPANDLEIPIQKYILYASGKDFFDHGNFTCKDYDKRRGVFEISMENDYNIKFENQEADFYYIARAIAYRETKRIKHCDLCKYEKEDFLANRFCALYKKFGTNQLCKDNDAHQCQYYRLDEKRYKYLISSIKTREDAGAIDIWRSSDWK